MTISPFSIVSSILNESSDNIDLLRILAMDARSRLKASECDMLIEAADELATARAACVMSYGKQLEAEQQLQATREQLSVANKFIGKVVNETLSMSGKFTFEMKIHDGYGA